MRKVQIDYYEGGDSSSELKYINIMQYVDGKRS